MADYIRRDIVLEIINTVNDTGGFAGYADYCVLFDEIDTMPAADVQPVPQWISVKDRLPEPEKEVLVWYRYTWGAGFTAYRFGISKWYSYRKRWYEGCLPKDIEVLYWQPLPEPPETIKG